MASKIEQMIDELQDYVEENGKPVMLKPDHITLNRDELDTYIEDLRANIPQEIRQYQRIINNQEAIIAEAKRKADAIIAEAEVQTTELVSEHQIMQQAYAQANEVVLIASKQAEEMLDKATQEANAIRTSAMDYTDGLLASVQSIMTAAIDTTRNNMGRQLEQMQGYLDIVTANRQEMVQGPEVEETPVQAEPEIKVPEAVEEKPEEPQQLEVPDAFFNKD